LPPETENEMIEKIAQFAVEKGLEFPMLIALESFGPLTSIFSNIGIAIFGPFLQLFNVDMLTALFRNKKNYSKIINRIEELKKEKETSKE